LPKRNFKLTIQYLGTSYNGWQYQPSHPTIQGEIESAFEKILHKNKQNINLIGSGRTDSGVHAYDQIANIILDTDISSYDLKNAINANLSKSIFIKECIEVDMEFHARFSAKKRSYVYRISKEYSPFINDREWYYDSVLDIGLLNQAADLILGTHDFTLLSKFNAEIDNRICDIYASSWNLSDDKLVYNIQGNRFLHHMVRYLVGTMLEIGKKNIPLDNLVNLLNNEDFSCLIFKAPSKGLYLNKIDYE